MRRTDDSPDDPRDHAGSAYDANFPANQACRFNSASLVPLAPQVERENLAGSFRFENRESKALRNGKAYGALGKGLALRE